MPDFGIGELLAGLGAFATEGGAAAGLGAEAAGVAAGTEAIGVGAEAAGAGFGAAEGVGALGATAGLGAGLEGGLGAGTELAGTAGGEAGALGAAAGGASESAALGTAPTLAGGISTPVGLAEGTAELGGPLGAAAGEAADISAGSALGGGEVAGFGTADPVASALGGGGSEAFLPEGALPASGTVSQGTDLATAMEAAGPTGENLASFGSTEAANPWGGMAGASPATGTAGGILKTLGQVAPLGLLAGTLIQGPPKLPSQIGQLSSTDAQLQDLANTSISNYNSGTLSPAQLAQIQTYKQNATNQARQQVASQGRDPQHDTAYLQMVQQIEQQAVAMQQQFLDSTLKAGLSASGQVSNDLLAAAKMQMASDQQFASSISAATTAIGLVAGAQSQPRVVVQAAPQQVAA